MQATLDIATLFSWLLAAGLGASVGLLTGLFGAGGGFILMPLLHLIFGVPMPVAVGTSTVQVAASSAFTLVAQKEKRWAGFRVSLCLILGTPLGVWLGGTLVEAAKGFGTIQLGGKTVAAVDPILLGLFFLLLLAIDTWLFIDNFYLRRGEKTTQDAPERPGLLSWIRIPPMLRFESIASGPFSLPLLVFLGFSIGIVSGLFGIGGGILLLPVLFYLVGQTTKTAVNTSLYVVFAAGICAVGRHAVAGNIDWALGGFLTLGAFFGAKGGILLQTRLHALHLRRYFAFVVLFALGLVGWKLLETVL